MTNANLIVRPRTLEASSSTYDIAFGLDIKYLPHAAAVMAALVKYAPGAKFRFIILHQGIPKERQTVTEQLVPSARFFWSELQDSVLPRFEERPHIKHVTRATLLRLGLESFAPADAGRVLYLDADVTVVRDVRELWNIDLDGHPIAAVTDPDVDARAFQKRWGLSENQLGYFNAGVLFVDLNRVRTEKLFSKAINFFAENETRYADQDALNWVAWGRWLPLNLTWNWQRNAAYLAVSPNAPSELLSHLGEIKIIHYTGDHKPWLPEAYHPWAWLYWKSLSQTPFFKEIAREYGVGPLKRLRLWVRWLLRQPRKGSATHGFHFRY